MRKLLTITVLGVAAGWFVLAAPATASAQFSISFGYNKGGSHGHHGHYHQPKSYFNFSYGGYPNYGYSGYSGYNSYHSGYGGYGSHYGHNHHSHSYYRPTIVQPEYYHWTPGKGYHSHGNVIVPHGNHYHVYPY